MAISCAKNLRVRCDGAHSKFHDLFSRIHSDEEWAWARPAESLLDSKKALDTFKGRSCFWKSWAIDDTLNLRKSFDVDVILAEIKASEELSLIIGRLERELSQLNAMQSARLSVETQSKVSCAAPRKRRVT